MLMKPDTRSSARDRERERVVETGERETGREGEGERERRGGRGKNPEEEGERETLGHTAHAHRDIDSIKGYPATAHAVSYWVTGILNTQ